MVSSIRIAARIGARRKRERRKPALPKKRVPALNPTTPVSIANGVNCSLPTPVGRGSLSGLRLRGELLPRAFRRRS
jgi:hypothetical protein